MKERKKKGAHSTNNLLDNNINPVKVYRDVYDMRKIFLKENKGKSGIYMLTNKLTLDIYIGQSKNISPRPSSWAAGGNRKDLKIILMPRAPLLEGAGIGYIKSRDNYIISRALIKYGYSNFSVTILEYCDKSYLLKREQYYLDKLNPQYNILKIAGSSRGFKHSEETKIKISKSSFFISQPA